MDGITILNTINGGFSLLATLLLYSFGIMFVIVAIMVIVISIQDNEPHPFIAFIWFSFGLFLLRSGYVSHTLPDQTRYQITVDDSVSFNDFMERYEIINQDGKIYTVIEKEE